MKKKILIVLGALVALVVGFVVYAAATAESRLSYPDTPMPEIAISTDPAVIEQGRYIVHGPGHCIQCHTTDDRSSPEKAQSTPLRGGLEFAMGPLATFYGRNLTPDPETGIAKYSDAALARVLRTGVMPDGQLSLLMTLAGGNLSEEDIIAVISYLRSIDPVKNEIPAGGWKLFGKILLTYAIPKLEPRKDSPAHVPPADEPSIERGHYLADHVALCTHCHSAFDMKTFQVSGPKAGGGLPDPSHGEDKDKEFVAPNLTSHPTGITGMMNEDAFVARMRGGRAFKSSIMPWEGYANTSEADMRSIYRYLASLPPVDNDVGPTYRDVGWKPAE
jgi:mono/diheme cytochrome c family protein